MTWVRVPRGDPPAQGQPVILFLHGCGECGEAYLDHAEVAAEHGYAGIAVSGPLGMPGRRHAWPGDGFETTHRHLQEMLAQCDARNQLDRSRILLCGFSQGATHAVGLLASKPEEYQGALAFSPGEGPAIPAMPSSASSPRAHPPVVRKSNQRSELKSTT